ncbi:MAG: glycosyltransferase family 4 protein [Isosphaeraceae bacterium]
MKKFRIFHPAGPGDIIHAHGFWRKGEHCPSEVTITFSSQFEQFCKEIGAEAYLVSYHPRKEILRDGAFTLEHRPKSSLKARGLKYHIREMIYSLGLLATAVRYRADVAVIDSGSTYYFLGVLYRLMGIRVIAVLHNTVWPHGFPPTSLVQRAILRLDAFFYRHAATAIIGVSPECVRQVEQLTRGRHAPLDQIRAQFVRDYFASIPPPPSFETRPFQIMFIGRVDHSKGVFDILEMAQKVEEAAPGQVRWEICGGGPALEALRARHAEMGLGSLVNIRGWTPLEDLLQVYARSQASIVPTRSSFAEGLAMTAAEAIMAGRPVITNPVVPALEIFCPACIAGQTNDVDSHVAAILKLIGDRELYENMRRACPELAEQFFDRSRGLTEVLKRWIVPIRDRKLGRAGTQPGIDGTTTTGEPTEVTAASTSHGV